jgi:DNA-binding CsgD family transcriptional regulator
MSIEPRNGSIFAVPAFLRFLSTYPDPQEVCDALLLGPLASFGAQSVNIFLTTSRNTFKIVGANGMTAPLVPRYQELSCSIHNGISQTVLGAETVTTTMVTQFEIYPDLAIDRHLWEDTAKITGDLRIDLMPIVSNGKVIGVYTMFCSPEHKLARADYSFLEGLGHLLGVWATHPFTDTDLEASLSIDTDEFAFMLNERQLQILELVEQGRSNAAIGVILGFSQSTVKQDLQRAMRVLRATDRTEAAARAREFGLQRVQEN